MKKMLIIKPDHIGDYILFRNFLAEVRKSERYGNCEITFLGNVRVRELAEYLDGDIIDHFLWIDLEKFTKSGWYWHFRTQEIIAKSYSVVINLMFARFQKVEDLILRIEAPHKIVVKGTHQERKTAYADKDLATYDEVIDLSSKKIFEYERFRCAFEKLLGKSLMNLPSLVLPQKQRIFSQDKPYIILFIGSDAEYRKWDKENYIMLIRHLMASYDMGIVLCGGAGEIDDGKYINKSFEDDAIFNLVGETALVDMMHLVAFAAFVVSNETGLAHMSTLMQIPTLVLSNGNNYGKFTPYPSFYKTKYFVLYPFEATNHEAMIEQFYEASRLDINGISVAKAIDTLDEIFLLFNLRKQKNGCAPLAPPVCKNTFNKKQEQINYQFSYMFSSLYFNILELTKTKQKFILYGYGSFAKVVHLLMQDNIVGIVDKGIDASDQKNASVSFIAPLELKAFEYDKILIGVLGRENEIEKYLIDELEVGAEKIIKLKVLEGRYIGC
ncbi:MAG: glycosyltransferase family 9 protein [Campylobacterales bacterium]|nr:glycosyltransferase family 9 protein [Campylobacterales bacterium]